MPTPLAVPDCNAGGAVHLQAEPGLQPEPADDVYQVESVRCPANGCNVLCFRTAENHAMLSTGTGVND